MQHSTSGKVVKLNSKGYLRKSGKKECTEQLPWYSWGWGHLGLVIWGAAAPSQEQRQPGAGGQLQHQATPWGLGLAAARLQA